MSFYTRRAFRILPPLLLLITTLGVLGLLRSRIELASCLALFRNYLPAASGGDSTAHIWSLSIEEHFYVVWPGLLLLLRRGKHPLLLTILAAAGIGLWRSLDMHLHLTQHLAPALDTGWRTDYRLDSLLWGCVAAFLLHRRRSAQFMRQHFSPAVMCVFVSAFCAALVVSIPLGAVWNAMLIPLMLLATITHPQWLFSRMLDLGPIRWVGRISYSLYLWQQMFLAPAWVEHPLGPLQRWPWNLVACFACAMASYYVVEKPMIRLGRKILAGMARDETIRPPFNQKPAYQNVIE